MKTLSGVDGAFLHLETPETPMHVGSLSLFELPPGYKGNFFAEIMDHGIDIDSGGDVIRGIGIADAEEANPSELCKPKPRLGRRSPFR